MTTSSLSKSFFGRIAPIAAIGMAAVLGGCDGMKVNINGEEGVELAELDMSGDAPTQVAIAGPDRLIIVDGDKLDIQTDGDEKAVGALRFSLEDGTLGIMREGSDWSSSSSTGGQATITVTMPTPSELVSLGSGRISAESLSGDSSASILGSGDIAIGDIAASDLRVSIMGSGKFSGAGSADALDLTVGGSGGFDAPELSAGKADISIVGSGSASFASDGKVEVSIAGSGNVTVTGNATCETSSMGSGTVTCTPGADAENAAENTVEDAAGNAVEDDAEA